MNNKSMKKMEPDNAGNGGGVRTSPMTTAELFQTVCGILDEKGMIPDILDYELPGHEPAEIKTCDYRIKNSLQYGGSEGIYLDLWIEYYEGGQKRCRSLGSFKTLEDDRKAMHVMANLLADFILEEHDYVKSHYDDFVWTGADVYAVNEKGEKSKWSYTCMDMDSALRKKDELLEEYRHIAVRDNATRKITEYKIK